MAICYIGVIRGLFNNAIAARYKNNKLYNLRIQSQLLHNKFQILTSIFYYQYIFVYYTQYRTI
jgi:hypothetical protein